MKQDVIKRILQTIRNKSMRDKLIKKVQSGQDLTLAESRMVYDSVEFGKELQMTKKRPVDIDWTDHAEYRGELRNINPDDMNDDIKNKLRIKYLKNPKSRGKEKLKGNPGTAVVDYDVDKSPAKADVVTTWASQSRRNEMKELKFASVEAAIQHLSDITGQRVVLASNSRYRKDKSIKTPEEMKKSSEEFAKSISKTDDFYPHLSGVMQSNYMSLYKEYERLAKLFQEVETELYEAESELDELNSN